MVLTLYFKMTFYFGVFLLSFYGLVQSIAGLFTSTLFDFHIIRFWLEMGCHLIVRQMLSTELFFGCFVSLLQINLC